MDAQHTKCPRASAATYNVFLKRKSDNKSVSVRLAEFVFLWRCTAVADSKVSHGHQECSRWWCGGERPAAVNRGVRVFPRDRVQDHREERLRGGPDRGQKAARRKALGTLNRVSLLGGRWTWRPGDSCGLWGWAVRTKVWKPADHWPGASGQGGPSLGDPRAGSAAPALSGGGGWGGGRITSSARSRHCTVPSKMVRLHQTDDCLQGVKCLSGLTSRKII